MPRCFNLTSKSTNQVMKLNEVDKMFCKKFNIEFSEQKWGGTGPERFDWYNTLGQDLATSSYTLDSQEFEKQWMESFEDSSPEGKLFVKSVLDWFKKNFSSTAWWEGK